MRKYLLATLSVAALGFASQTVLAADVETAPAAYDWSGPYLGATAGYGWGDTTHFNGPADTGNLSIEGFVGGVEAGFNYQMDSMVLGLEADISFSDIDGSHGPALFDTFNCGTSSCDTDVNWLSTVRARLGYSFDNFLPFIAGGLAIGGLEAGIRNDSALDDFDENTELGWTIGGGVAYALSDSVSVKAEYLYVDFGKFRYDDGTEDPSFDADARFSIVRAGVDFNF
jgi:outer membrane immunogenic protein